MQVELVVCLAQQGSAESATVTLKDDKTVQFKCPPAFSAAKFPVGNATFEFDRVFAAETPNRELHDATIANAVTSFLEAGQNTVIYAYGERGTPKHRCLFGSSADIAAETLASTNPNSGLAHLVLESLLAAAASDPSLDLRMQGCLLGADSQIIDIMNVQNAAAPTESDLLNGLTSVPLQAYQDAAEWLKKAAENVEDELGIRASEDDDRWDPTAYNPMHAILAITLFASPAEGEPPIERNSMYFIALADSERPPLCGFDLIRATKYDDAHRTHSAVLSTLNAIRCNRLRIPFTKSKLTNHLRRAYNQEKSLPFRDRMQPTRSLVFFYVLTDDLHTEETFHTLSAAHRVSNVMGAAGGPASRDTNVEKWRLEQDISQLRDELSIAQIVHGYKPCIYNQGVRSIQEEEQKRMAVASKRKEEQAARLQAEMLQQAQEEAKIILEQEATKSASNLQSLEQTLVEKTKEQERLTSERDEKVKDYEKQLSKTRKKKVEEKDAVQKAIADIRRFHEESKQRTVTLAKSKEIIHLIKSHQKQSKSQFKAAKANPPEQRQQLAQERRKELEEGIKAVEAKEILLEDNGTGADELEKKLAAIADAEEQHRKERITSEESRKAEMDKAAEVYNARIHEYQLRQLRDQLVTAMTHKKTDRKSFQDTVLRYMQNGCRMVKIPSKGSAKKRFFFLGEDCTKIFACEMDDLGAPINRKKPTTTILLKDIKCVILGQYIGAFENFGKGKRPWPEEKLMDDEDGPFNPTTTGNVTSSNIAKYFYRSFTFDFKGKGKSLDLITECDADFEAWVFGMRTVLAAEEPGATVNWGAPLGLERRVAFDALEPTERQLCAREHITPRQFLDAKATLSAAGKANIFEVRKQTSLDIIRSEAVHAHLVASRIIKDRKEREKGGGDED
eukprot:TRINITY_DN4092_c0_g1_i1.p1 TRINITY_DN4092_c0_g1~~TRINITY_DN4092_c0_g1_i1.p1  ORF type:complete len:903 (+),score=193.33 TRINITY_DN4092_c0_g1_i1:82-2790(+)